MGYTTYFDGSFKFNKPIVDGLVNYINKFASTRHMKRDVHRIKQLYPNWESECFMKELGTDGEYFIGGSCGYMDRSDDIISYNDPPCTQPGLWCQWIINEKNELVWDNGEKFYNYIEWLEYLINHFFAPFDYILNGEMMWQGEDYYDQGIIVVNNNKISLKERSELICLK